MKKKEWPCPGCDMWCSAGRPKIRPHLCPDCRRRLRIGELVEGMPVKHELWHLADHWALAVQKSEGVDDYGDPAEFLDVLERGATPLEALEGAKK